MSVVLQAGVLLANTVSLAQLSNYILELLIECDDYAVVNANANSPISITPLKGKEHLVY